MSTSVSSVERIGVSGIFFTFRKVQMSDDPDVGLRDGGEGDQLRGFRVDASDSLFLNSYLIDTHSESDSSTDHTL